MRPLSLAFVAALMSPTMAPAAFALDTSAIQPHMEVVGTDGAHVGTVDKIDGDQMVLTKNDPAAGGTHHQLPITAVDSVSDSKVKLKDSAALAHAAWLPVGKPGDDKAK